MAQFTPPFAEENKEQAAPAAAPQEQPAAPAQEAAPAAAPAAPQAATPAADAEPAKKKVERKATRQINKDDILYVCKNVTTMSYNDMAEKLGLTRHQVNRILMDTKKTLRDSYKDDDGKVVDEAKKAKVEEYIASKLSRPEDSRVGSKKGSPVRDAMNDVVSEILGNL